MRYTIDDRELDVSAFISFANQIWKGDYDADKTGKALKKNAQYHRL